MKCDLKTMLKLGLALGGVITVVAIVLPQFRPVVIGLAPFALFALCPISMWVAMRGMHKGQHDYSDSDNGQRKNEQKN